MSYQATKAVLDGPRSIKGQCLNILSSLAEWADASGKVIYQKGPLFLEVIAARARCSTRTVTRTVAWLEEQGFLTVVRTHGRGRESQYYIDLEALRRCSDDERVDNLTGQNVYDEGERLDNMSTFSGERLDNDDTSLRGVKVPYLKHNEESESAGAREKKTTLPEGFVVTPSMLSWALGKFPELDVGEATETWQDDMVAKGFEYVDWPAAWRKGMRNAVKWAAERAASSGGNGNGNGRTKEGIGRNGANQSGRPESPSERMVRQYERIGQELQAHADGGHNRPLKDRARP